MCFCDVKEDSREWSLVRSTYCREVISKPACIYGRDACSTSKSIRTNRSLSLEKPGEDPFTELANLVQEWDGTKLRGLGLRDGVNNSPFPTRRDMTERRIKWWCVGGGNFLWGIAKLPVECQQRCRLFQQKSQPMVWRFLFGGFLPWQIHWAREEELKDLMGWSSWRDCRWRSTKWICRRRISWGGLVLGLFLALMFVEKVHCRPIIASADLVTKVCLQVRSFSSEAGT